MMARIGVLGVGEDVVGLDTTPQMILDALGYVPMIEDQEAIFNRALRELLGIEGAG